VSRAVPTRRQRFAVLDSFRGLFALCVVVFHMRYTGSFTELDIFRGSYHFVEFFFVLSGFVMAHGYGARPGLTLKSFASSRFWRLVPLHVVMLAVFLVLELGKLLAVRGGVGLHSAPFTGPTAPLEVLPNLFLVHAWLPWTDRMSFNFPSWSISIEFYVYLVFYGLLRLKGALRYAAWSVLVLAMSGMLIAGKTWLVSDVLVGVSCFFAGALTYAVFQNTAERVPRRRGVFTVLEGLCLVLVISTVGSEFARVSVGAVAAVTVVFGLTIYVYAFEAGWFSRGLRAPALLWAGQRSYSIYMVHAAVLFAVMVLAMAVGAVGGRDIAPLVDGVRRLDLGHAAANNLLGLVVVGLVLLVARLTYRYVEEKWRQ